jgi:hypothetical protein
MSLDGCSGISDLAIGPRQADVKNGGASLRSIDKLEPLVDPPPRCPANPLSLKFG